MYDSIRIPIQEEQPPNERNTFLSYGYCSTHVISLELLDEKKSHHLLDMNYNNNKKRLTWTEQTN